MLSGEEILGAYDAKIEETRNYLRNQKETFQNIQEVVRQRYAQGCKEKSIEVAQMISAWPIEFTRDQRGVQLYIDLTTGELRRPTERPEIGERTILEYSDRILQEISAEKILAALNGQ